MNLIRINILVGCIIASWLVDAQATACAENNCLFGTVLIGDSCRLDTDCVANDGADTRSSCNNLVCACNSGFISSQGRDDCLEILDTIGSPCIEDSQCQLGVPGDLSECFGSPPSATCRCQSGAVKSGNSEKCLPGGVLIGQPCEEHIQCLSPGSVALCSLGRICSCPRDDDDDAIDDYVHSKDHTRCLQIIHAIGGPCEEDQQCQQGGLGELSECAQGDTGRLECNCTSDAVAPLLPKCYKKATTIGDTCEVQEQCTSNLPHSQCLTGACKCLPGFVPDDTAKKCLPIQNLNEECEHNVQCQVANSSCQLAPELGPDVSTCQCDAAFVIPHNPPTNRCIVASALVGDFCEEDPGQCDRLENTKCVLSSVDPDQETRTCECLPGFPIVSAGKTKCLTTASGLDDHCEETVQCTAVVQNSECVGGRCRCAVGQYVELSGACWEIVTEINKPCVHDAQCIAGLGDKSECRNNVCQCGRDYGYYNHHCYIRAGLGMICSTHEECFVGINNITACLETGVGNDKRCRCWEGAIDHNGLCYAPKLVGESCKETLECTLNISGDVYCHPTTQVCTCVDKLGDSGMFGTTCSGTVTFSVSLLVLGLLSVIYFLS